MRTFLGVLGVCISLVSSFFVVAAIGDLVHGSKTEPGVLVGLLVFFLGTGFAGAILARAGFRKKSVGPPPITDFEQEQRILSLAESTGGRVTVSEVALHCHLSIADSQAMLDRMASQGVAELQVADDGSFIYAFTGFLLEERKTLPADETGVRRRESEVRKRRTDA